MHPVYVGNIHLQGLPEGLFGALREGERYKFKHFKGIFKHRNHSTVVVRILYRVFIKYCVFSKNYQPLEVTVHSHCVEGFEGLLQRCRGCSELEKNTFFS